MTRVLVAGIGNVLRGDDGFGPAVIEALRNGNGTNRLRLADVGIGGLALVRELLDGYDALIAIDCMRRGGARCPLSRCTPKSPRIEIRCILPRGCHSRTARRTRQIDRHSAATLRAC